jgi:hypothetical protein
MKIIFKVLTAILALGAVILFGLHLFLQHGLTKTLREVVLPRVKEETGIDARVGRLSLNVPKGLLYLNEIEVKNPEGFLLENLASVERIQLEVDLLALLKKQLIVVKNIEVEKAWLNLVRNKQGELNINRLREELPPPPGPGAEQPVPDPLPGPEKEPAPVPEAPAPEPLPELLVEAMQCRAKVRYVDFKLNQLDLSLDLNVIGSNLSTQRDPGAPWGEVSVIGSLGNDRASFITDLQMRLAPVTDPAVPSFDLTGRVLEIDPRILDEAYSKLGIRSAPFGLDPRIQCRDGWFEDSTVSLNLTDIVFEDKLARRLGGMASIGALRFPVSIEGSLREPRINVQQALYGAIGGNAENLLDSFLKGAAAKEAGLETPPEDLAEAAVEVLGSHVDEIGDSETVKKVLKDLADGEPSATNAPSPVSSDVLVEMLGEQVEEIGENEELKDELKNLGKWLFGK